MVSTQNKPKLGTQSYGTRNKPRYPTPKYLDQTLEPKPKIPQTNLNTRNLSTQNKP